MYVLEPRVRFSSSIFISCSEEGTRTGSQLSLHQPPLSLWLLLPSSFPQLSLPLFLRPEPVVFSPLYHTLTLFAKTSRFPSNSHFFGTIIDMQQKPKQVLEAGAGAGAPSGSRPGWRASSYNTEIEVCMVLRYAYSHSKLLRIKFSL